MNTGSMLSGGNMNSPILRDNLVYKEVTNASNTIHQLLTHVHNKGIHWVPESMGIDIASRKHVLTYIKGTVPHDTPDWIWSETVLCDVARRLREWHDATVDFQFENAGWLLSNDEAKEVICHNDFAPYNCVFQDGTFVGLIDFDVCCPGSRVWDIAYTVYRFVPLLPDYTKESGDDISPFSIEVVKERLRKFLKVYSGQTIELLYKEEDVIRKVSKRLMAIAEWSKAYGLQMQKEEMVKNANMYLFHANWVLSLL